MKSSQCTGITLLLVHTAHGFCEHASACKQIMRVWTSHACLCNILSAISPAPALNTSALQGNVLLLSAMTIVHGLLQV